MRSILLGFCITVALTGTTGAHNAVRNGVGFPHRTVLGSKYGDQVAVHGDIAIVASPSSKSAVAGRVFIYERDGDAWHLRQALVANDSSPSFGESLAFDGTTIVVATAREETYVFEKDLSGRWQAVATLYPTGIDTANQMFSLNTGNPVERITVDVDGDTAVASYEIRTSPYPYQFQHTGIVVIFQRDSGSGDWIELTRLVSPLAQLDDGFGWRVAIFEDRLVATGHGPTQETRQAYVFERHAGGTDQWGQTATLLPEHVGGQFDMSVDLDEDTVVLAGRTESDSDPYTSEFAIFVFQHSPGGPTEWTHTATLGPGGSGVHGPPVINEGRIFAHRNKVVNRGSKQLLVFEEHSSGDWPQVAQLSVRDITGDPMLPELEGPVAVDGSRVVVGGDGNAYTFDLDLSVAVDFGSSGLWELEGDDWTKLADWDPDLIQVWRHGRATSFGAGRGLWSYADGAWTQLASWAPYAMLRFDRWLVASFDGGRGTWMYGSDGWTQMTNWETEHMAASGSRLLVAFGAGRGLWTYDEAGGWLQLSPGDPYDIAFMSWEGWPVALFDASQPVSYQGVAYYNGLFGNGDGGTAGWQHLSSLQPDSMIEDDDRLVFDFGAGWGVWAYERNWKAGTSNQLSPQDPDALFVSMKRLFADFGASEGLWMQGPDPEEPVWTKIHDWQPTDWVADRMLFDFGPGRGLYRFSTADGWKLVTTVSPENIE